MARTFANVPLRGRGAGGAWGRLTAGRDRLNLSVTRPRGHSTASPSGFSEPMGVFRAREARHEIGVCDFN